ncbi:MAG: hypothetical protein U0V74_09370 [Chitinophagales bacterium]
MSTSIKTFFAANKTAILIGCAAVVITAKSMSFYSQMNKESEAMVNQPQQMQQPQQQPNGQMQQQAYGNMGGNYNNQAPQQMNNNQDGGFWGNMFGSDEESYGGNENNNGYANNGYTGYTNGYNAYSNYNGGYTNTGNTYNSGSNVDYTSGWYATQQANDRMHEKFTDYITDQGRYTDENGNDYKMSSGYDYNYVNTTTNQSLQTNDAGYDPNAYSSSSYSSLTPSDYSSSSYTTTTPE